MKHSFLSLEKHAGQLPRLGQDLTPSRRGVVPTATFESVVGKNLGFPLDRHEEQEHEELEEHEHEGDECKDRNLLLQQLRLHVMNSKTWNWVPTLKDLIKTNTKT